MKKRIRLKHNYFINIKTRDKSILIFLLIVFCTFCLSFYFDRMTRLTVLEYARNETKTLSTYVINEAVNEFNTILSSSGEFITETKDKEGKILSIDFNTVNVNNSLNAVNKNILVNLKKLERGDFTYLNIEPSFKYDKLEGNIIYYVPFGLISDNMFLNALGPKIPLRMYAVGNIVSNIRTSVECYGINNVLFKMFIEVEVTEKVLLPFISDNVVVNVNIPIVIKIIEGSIPNVYGGLLTNTSSLNTLNVK